MASGKKLGTNHFVQLKGDFVQLQAITRDQTIQIPDSDIVFSSNSSIVLYITLSNPSMSNNADAGYK